MSIWSLDDQHKKYVVDRQRTLIGQLDRIARIHSARVKSVDLSNGTGDPAPGWSYDGGITLSGTHLPEPVSVDDVTVWLAVLMHEVGHCEASPKTVEGVPHVVYNIAEDSRQEALLIAKLPGVIGPLTQAVSKLIIDSPQATPRGLWPLIAGRTYLPADLRREVRDGAVADMGHKWVAEVAVLVARYMKLSDPGYSDRDEAVEVLLKLADLLGVVPPEEQPQHECGSQGSPDPPIGGVDVSPEDICDFGETTEEPGDESDEPGDGTRDSDGEGDEEAESGGGGSGATEGEGEGNGEGDGGGEGDSEKETDGTGGGGAGLGKPNPKAEAAKQKVREEAEKAAKPDAATRRQAKVILRRMREETHRRPDSEDVIDGTIAASPEARGAVARLNRHLKPLIDAAEAGTDRMTSAGRIRPDRIAAGYRPDHVFDKWRLDQDDAVSAEIVVAVDTSGSMQPYGTQLSEAVWILRSVVQRTAANLTVISWNSHAGTITKPASGAVDRLRITGGTDPIPMLEIATDVFSRSRMKRKWMIVMTDGQIHSTSLQASKQVVAGLVGNGVTISAIEFGEGANAELFGDNRQRISNLSEIPEMVGGMLRRVYRSNVSR